MFRSRTRKILRDIWARKGRTTLVSMAIFIGVTGTIALFSMSDILISQLQEDIQEDKLAMITVYMEPNPGVQLENAEYLKGLSEFPGVTSIMGGEADNPVSFKLKENDEEFEDGAVQSAVIWDGNAENPGLINVPFNAEQPLEPLRLLTEGERNEAAGRWPDPGQNEVVIERRMAEEYDLKVGDTLYFRVPSPSRDPQRNGETGTVEPWTITGIVFDPYSLSPKVAVYTDLPNSNYLAGTTGMQALWVRFTDFGTAEDQSSEFQNFIANDENTPYEPRFAQITDPAENPLVANARLIGNLMGTLALIALIVSGFLVINVITSIVLEQKRQIGVMKSLGGTRWDNFVIYSGIAFMYGVIAVIPGVILGIPLGHLAAKALAPQVNTVLEGFNFSPNSIILGIAVGLMIPVLASLLPVFNGTRVKILEAMTDLGIDARYGSGLLARIIGRLPIPITIRQGLSNISIKKSRLAFTVITLAIAVGAFMGITAIFETMSSGFQAYLDTFNVQVGIAPTQSGDPERFETLLVEQFGDRIKSIEPGFSVQVEFEGYEPVVSPFGPPGIFAYGYDVNSEDPAFRFTVTDGDPLTAETADDGVIFSSALAYNMDKNVGDKVVMKVPGGKQELTIVGISDFPVDQVWIDWHILAHVASFMTDTISNGSPVDAVIPDEARTFIKYASIVQVEGFEAEQTNPLMPAGVFATGLGPSAGQFLRFTDGEFFSPENPGIIISQDMAEKGNFAVGDELTLVSTVPENGTTQTYPIVGIFDASGLASPVGEGEQNADQGVGIPSDLIGIFWKDLAALDGATVTSEPRPQIYFINSTNENATAKEVDELTDDINETMLSSGFPIFALNFVELVDQLHAGIRIFQAVLSAVAGLIALVGALGLLTTLSMSVYERQKEIGVMRSIGAGSSTIALQFLTEGLVVGIIAWLVGLPLMLLVQFLLVQIIGPELFSVETSPVAITFGLVGMLIITTIASLWPSLSAARKTVSDILRYQ